MQSLLNEIVTGNVFAFLLIFMRFGLALMIMPGIGDSFVTPQARLLFALALSFILTPALSPALPAMPTSAPEFILLLLSEAFIGLFIGTIMRIMISALDTAGTVVSIQAGFSSAFVFNPVTATQGSVTGALYSMLGVTLLLMTNMHHMMLAAVVDSYRIYPAALETPDMASAAQTISLAVTAAFKTGVLLAMPFLVVGLVVQFGFGLLGRLMPQIQIFFLALPLQIFLSLVIMFMTLSACMLYWLGNYEGFVTRFLGL